MNQSEKYPVRSRLLFFVAFFSFFLGVQSLMNALSVMAALASSKGTEVRQELLQDPVFTYVEIELLLLYQLTFSIILLVSAYLILVRLNDRFRQLLKAAYAVDVFVFLAILIFYSHLAYRPPDRDVFYYQVFHTMMEILMIICLSHPSVLHATQASQKADPGEESVSKGRKPPE